MSGRIEEKAVARIAMALLAILALVAAACGSDSASESADEQDPTESAESVTLFKNPRHAYTRALLQSIPATHQRGEDLQTIPGLPPDLSDEPTCCSFRPRNTLGDSSQCLTDRPPQLEEIAPSHWVQNCPGCLAR